MKNNIALLLFIVILSFSCTENQQQSGNIKTIELQKTKDIQPVSSFISGVRYIELKYPENISPGKIESVKLLNNEIVVQQKYSGKNSLIRFSANGEFLNKIGELSETKDIQNPRDIVSYNNDFAVWGQNSVHIFSKAGDYQRKIMNLNKPGNRFLYSDGKFWFFHESTPPGYLSGYTLAGKLDNVFHPVKNTVESTEYSAIAEVKNNNFHLFSPLNDTIFVFSGEKLTPKYVIEGGSYPTYIELISSQNFDDEFEKSKFINNNQHWRITRYLENEDFIFVVYRLGSYPFHLIINKSDWQVSYIKDFINDIDGGIWDDPFYLSENNELYVPLASYQVSGHTVKNKKRHNFDEQMDIAQQNDNPFLMVCKLK